VPRAADNGHPVVLFFDRPYVLAHRRFPLRFQFQVGTVEAALGVSAQLGHRFGDRVPGFFLGAVLDYVFPPTFGVVVAGRLGQLAYRVAGQDFVVARAAVFRPFFAPVAEQHPGGQVDHRGRDTSGDGVLQCHPLRRPRGHRVKRAERGLAREIGEQCHGWAHLR